MKKKYLNIPLFLFVVIIYGAIFLKLFGKKQVVEDNISNNMTYLKTISNYNVKRDSFDISSLEKDPFRIHRRIKKEKSPKAQTAKSKPISKINSSTKVWPKITYYGFVKNDSKPTRLALLKVDSRLYRKRETESIEGLTLVKVFNDSIVLRLYTETKTIYRE